jgi:hypothetical protein
VQGWKAETVALMAVTASRSSSNKYHLWVLLQQRINQAPKLWAVPAGQWRIAAPQNLHHQCWQAASIKRAPQASQLIQHTAYVDA